MAQTTNTSDNSGMGVILGIVIAVLLVVGGFYFLRAEGVIDTSTAKVETPDITINKVEPAGGSSN